MTEGVARIEGDRVFDAGLFIVWNSGAESAASITG